MKGDYYRYLAEFMVDGDAKRAASETARLTYDEVFGCARTNLGVTHPIYLSSVLSNAVFTSDVLNMPEEASRIARKAFDDALPELDSLDEVTYKEVTLIMQLLRDNFKVWSPSQGDGGEP